MGNSGLTAGNLFTIGTATGIETFDTKLAIQYSTGNVGIGTVLADTTHCTYAKVNIQDGNLLLTGQSSTAYERARAGLATGATDNTDATRKYYGKLSAWDTAEREAIRFGASGSESLLSFHGASLIKRQNMYDYTSDPQSSAYTGAADGEAKLADLNALRAGYEEVRTAVEDLRSLLDTVGLLFTV